ncbi:hypothetical protein ACH4NT_14645 [Streptomyces lydicus]|uniref:hypothetical protein n=1 Tax=Streptomyces lydicus TaxID=47763 RepID=UPI003794D9E8
MTVQPGAGITGSQQSVHRQMPTCDADGFVAATDDARQATRPLSQALAGTD